MARKQDRLSVKAVEAKRQPGYYADGGGLYLQVSPSGSKSWIFRFMLKGKEHEMGLGSMLDVSLAEAREKRDSYRKLVRSGVDPIKARKQQKLDNAIAEARSLTFSDCATAYIQAHRPAWKNTKHAEQWESTLSTYCGPVFGPLPVQHVDTGLVLKVLEPVWTTKRETATRLRGRIERVLDWAKVRGYREGENPARWRGHLDKLLAKDEKKKRVRHHPALPFAQIGDFIKDLRAQEGLAARALEFLVLTATRTNEVIYARWAEFDLDAALWTIPESRMKGHREHRVPLSGRALEILRQLNDRRTSEYVFPGQRINKPLSNMAMLKLLERMRRDNLTVHGFRSTFRDWASERTNYPREVCEMALAHAVSDQVEAAYRRGDLFEKRRNLMDAWAAFCELPSSAGEVLRLRRAS